MPAVLKTLDQIGREKQRDVLFVSFHTPIDSPDLYGCDNYDWENCESRKNTIKFLEELGVHYECSAPPQPADGMLILAMPYRGEIYIDIPADEESPIYQSVESYFENHDNQSVVMWNYPLELAMKNAEHDKPGFWDNM